MWAEGTLLEFILTTSYLVFISPILKWRTLTESFIDPGTSDYLADWGGSNLATRLTYFLEQIWGQNQSRRWHSLNWKTDSNIELRYDNIQILVYVPRLFFKVDFWRLSAIFKKSKLSGEGKRNICLRNCELHSLELWINLRVKDDVREEVDRAVAI